MKATYVFMLALLFSCNGSGPRSETPDNSDDSVSAPPADSSRTEVIATPLTDAVVGERIAPNELAKIIVDVLEELRPSLEGASLPFSQAELTVAAKSGIAGEGGLSVKLASAKLSGEQETALTVTYQLKQLLETASKEKIAIANLENTVREIGPTDESSRARALNRLKSVQLPEDSDLAAIRRKSSLGEAQKIIETTKARKLMAKEVVQSGSVLVDAVKEAIVEYNQIKLNFNQTCFDVEIGFNVKVTGTAGIDLELVSGEISKSDGWEHSLKLSFGKCD